MRWGLTGICAESSNHYSLSAPFSLTASIEILLGGGLFPTIFVQGMSNAACKLFCDGFTHHGLPAYSPMPEPKKLNITLAEERLGTCVVGIQVSVSLPKILPALGWLIRHDRFVTGGLGKHQACSVALVPLAEIQ